MITLEQVREALCLVDDPELGVNVVDLGLVYGLEVRDDAVRVAITMTTPACPLHAYLADAIETVVRARLPEVHAVRVEIVWDPPWEPAMMSDRAFSVSPESPDRRRAMNS
jgi:metal-sulfur cluster biosynthetic enzyme